MGLFTNLKQKIPKTELSGCVYRIDCNDCPSCYIGETVQKLGARIKQHESLKEKTALKQHCDSKNHQFNFNDVKILKRERNKKRLQIQEVNHIVRNDNVTCNFKSDSQHIAPVYCNLIKLGCRQTTTLHNNNNNNEIASPIVNRTQSSVDSFHTVGSTV